MHEKELTFREKEILKSLSLGHSNNQIADVLGISVNTVKTHLKHIFKKLDVENRTAAVTAFLQAVKDGKDSPISFRSICLTTLTTFKILDSLATGMAQEINLDDVG